MTFFYFFYPAPPDAKRYIVFTLAGHSTGVAADALPQVEQHGISFFLIVHDFVALFFIVIVFVALNMIALILIIHIFFIHIFLILILTAHLFIVLDLFCFYFFFLR